MRYLHARYYLSVPLIDTGCDIIRTPEAARSLDQFGKAAIIVLLQYCARVNAAV